MQLAERYGRLALLGQGGHGEAYQAYDQALDRPVVLKCVAQSAFSSEVARRYFLREFKLVSKLQHPNIVRVFDVGMAAGVMYYAMEHLAGHDLSVYLLNEKPLRHPGFLYSVVQQVAEALDYAHSHGVLHLDVKPSKIMVLPKGDVKLFDFGLARGPVDDRDAGALLLGTTSAIAPEQLGRGVVDHRADLYALGVVLHRMATGRMPGAAPSLAAVDTGLATQVAPVVQRLLATDPADRYQSGRAVAYDLHRALFPG